MNNIWVAKFWRLTKDTTTDYISVVGEITKLAHELCVSSFERSDPSRDSAPLEEARNVRRRDRRSICTGPIHAVWTFQHSEKRGSYRRREERNYDRVQPQRLGRWADVGRDA